MPRRFDFLRPIFTAAIVFASLASLARSPAVAADVAPPVRLVRVPLDDRVTLKALLEAGLDIVEVHGRTEAMIYAKSADDAILTGLGARVELVDANPGATAAEIARRDLASRPRPASAPILVAPFQ